MSTFFICLLIFHRFIKTLSLFQNLLTCQRIPLVSVGDAVHEGSAVVTAVPLVHGGVVVRVHLGQVNKHVIIRGDAGPAHLLAA